MTHTLQQRYDLLVPLVIQLPYTLFTGLGAVLTGSVIVGEIPAGYRVESADIVSTAEMVKYVGPSVTSATISLGITGTLAKFTAATNVLASGEHIGSGLAGSLVSVDSVTNLLATITTVGADVNVLTGGSCTAYVSLRRVCATR
jgi:hypothetical protein